jgi:hypothetical protein
MVTNKNLVLAIVFLAFIFVAAINGQERKSTIEAAGQLVQILHPRIEFKKSTVYVNGRVIKLPISPKDLRLTLGPPTRTADKLGYISTWDDIGLLAYQESESSDVYQLSVILNNTDMEFDFWPKTVFNGTLIIDGAVIESNNSTAIINRKKIGTKFRPVSSLTPFLLEIKSGGLQVLISRATGGDFSASGRIVEVAITRPDQ